MSWLGPAFAVAALIYASVGFGGGSAYTALLLLGGVGVAVVPVIALACNIIVVALNSSRFAAAGIIPWRLGWPMLVLGAPAAFAGGQFPIREGALALLLGASLIVAGVLLLVQRKPRPSPLLPPVVATLAAAPLAFLAGMVGIGGGIFLAPLLHLAAWEEERRIAAFASLFILVNSLFGMAGQMLKRGPDATFMLLEEHVLLGVAVLAGGAIGGRLVLAPAWSPRIRIATAILVIAVATHLILT